MTPAEIIAMLHGTTYTHERIAARQRAQEIAHLGENGTEHILEYIKSHGDDWRETLDRAMSGKNLGSSKDALVQNAILYAWGQTSPITAEQADGLIQGHMEIIEREPAMAQWLRARPGRTFIDLLKTNSIVHRRCKNFSRAVSLLRGEIQ